MVLGKTNRFGRRAMQSRDWYFENRTGLAPGKRKTDRLENVIEKSPRSQDGQDIQAAHDGS